MARMTKNNIENVLTNKQYSLYNMITYITYVC